MAATSVTRADAGKALRSHLRFIEEMLGEASDLINGKNHGRFDEMLTALGRLHEIETALPHAIHWLAAVLASSDASWRQIGDELGITRQAAQQRYGSTLVDRRLPVD